MRALSFLISAWADYPETEGYWLLMKHGERFLTRPAPSTGT